MAILFMMCGLPGSGKTTLARQFEVSENALRLCPDEWIAQLLPDHKDAAEMDRLRAHVESIQWEVAKRALLLGVNVVLENGFWSKAERNAYRQEAETLGAQVKICFLDIPLARLWERLSIRNSNLPFGSFLVTKEKLELWADSFEPPGEDEQFERFS
jgi:predicted kinase